jgi:hypothetical protein
MRKVKGQREGKGIHGKDGKMNNLEFTREL